MHSLKSGFAFFRQAWQFARKNPDLARPSLISILAGLVLTLIGLAPIILIVLRIGDSLLKPALIGFFGVLIIFAQLAAGYVVSIMTAYLFNGFTTGGEKRLSKARAILRLRWSELLNLAAAAVGVSLWQSRAAAQPTAAYPTSSADWRSATYLVQPVMAVENLDLKASLERAGQMARDHLLRIGVHWVGVRKFSLLAGAAWAALGIALGALAGILIASSGDAPALSAAGVAAGFLIASLFSLTAIAAGNYAVTAYYTLLYQWASSVERAQQDNLPGTVPAPDMLAQALGASGGQNRLREDRYAS